MTNMYITYEQPFEGRTFTSDQLKEVYRDLADKTEYPDFTIWLTDMVKSGVFEIMTDGLNAKTVQEVIYSLFSDLKNVSDADIQVAHFIVNLVYRTNLYEEDAVKLAKEYCLHGCLSLNKYKL